MLWSTICTFWYFFDFFFCVFLMESDGSIRELELLKTVVLGVLMPLQKIEKKAVPGARLKTRASFFFLETRVFKKLFFVFRVGAFWGDWPDGCGILWDLGHSLGLDMIPLGGMCSLLQE